MANKMEGGPKDVAVFENNLAICKKSIILLPTTSPKNFETWRGGSNLWRDRGATRFSDWWSRVRRRIDGISESFPLDGVRSLYGATKLAAELFIGIRAVVNRCGVLSGPWQMGKVDQGFVSLWLARHLFGGRLSYIGYGGAGTQVRDVLHVSDLRRLIDMQIGDECCARKTYNVGGGPDNSISLLELTRQCQSLTGATIEIGSRPETPAPDVPYYVTDNSMVRSEIGWRPKESLIATLADVHKWLVDNRAVVAPIFTEGK
jgi:CDP-paratose 2-epimerase